MNSNSQYSQFNDIIIFILEWLDIPWDDVVLQHDQNIEGVNLPRYVAQFVFY